MHALVTDGLLMGLIRFCSCLRACFRQIGCLRLYPYKVLVLACVVLLAFEDPIFAIRILLMSVESSFTLNVLANLVNKRRQPILLHH